MTVRAELELLSAGTRSTEQLAERLDAFPLLSDLTYQEKQILARHMHVYGAGQDMYIFREGDEGDFLCFVLEGRVELVKEAASMEEKVLGDVRAGKTIGEMALIDGERRSASARCPEPVEVALLTRASFEKLSATHTLLSFKLLGKLAKLMSQRLRQTTGQLVDRMDH